ncbi:hypothetical protein MC885_005052 [Smutsia gigantea]|nr:hypothetical protein MC885_005052 [Smutsia gigantea]
MDTSTLPDQSWALRPRRPASAAVPGAWTQGQSEGSSSAPSLLRGETCSEGNGVSRRWLWMQMHGLEGQRWPSSPGRPQPSQWALWGEVQFVEGWASSLDRPNSLPYGAPPQSGGLRTLLKAQELYELGGWLVGTLGQPCPLLHCPPTGVYIVFLGLGRIYGWQGASGWGLCRSPSSAWHQALSSLTGLLTLSSL